MTSLYEFAVRRPDGSEQPLSDFRDKVLLIVNVASRCGFTPQYAGLEALYRNYRHMGLVVLGFPCNQFRHQEPGNAEEIAGFCSLQYDVTFPVLGKIDVNGKHSDPFYVWLKRQRPGLLGSQGIKWNFTKFLVDRTGDVVGRYASVTKPMAMEAVIKALLI